MQLSFSCMLDFPLCPASLHNTCHCELLFFTFTNWCCLLIGQSPTKFHPSWKKIGCISIPSKSVQVFGFKFLVWYTRSKNLNSRNLNGDLDAKLASCIPGFKIVFPWEGLKTYIALELHGQNDSKCSMIGFLELPLDMH